MESDCLVCLVVLLFLWMILISKLESLGESKPHYADHSWFLFDRRVVWRNSQPNRCHCLPFSRAIYSFHVFVLFPCQLSRCALQASTTFGRGRKMRTNFALLRILAIHIQPHKYNRFFCNTLRLWVAGRHDSLDVKEGP
jgi:hypothetical protein